MKITLTFNLTKKQLKEITWQEDESVPVRPAKKRQAVRFIRKSVAEKLRYA